MRGLQARYISVVLKVSTGRMLALAFSRSASRAPLYLPVAQKSIRPATSLRTFCTSALARSTSKFLPIRNWAMASPL